MAFENRLKLILIKFAAVAQREIDGIEDRQFARIAWVTFEMAREEQATKGGGVVSQSIAVLEQRIAQTHGNLGAQVNIRRLGGGGGLEIVESAILLEPVMQGLCDVPIAGNILRGDPFLESQQKRFRQLDFKCRSMCVQIHRLVAWGAERPRTVIAEFE